MAKVLLASRSCVPSLTKVITNLRPDAVPVTKVVVALKPEPKVTVLEVVPLVTIITRAVVPAGGTVVVRVTLALTVT
jgi:hypothetical protein